jgi:hypothetical protein
MSKADVTPKTIQAWRLAVFESQSQGVEDNQSEFISTVLHDLMLEKQGRT